MKKQLTLILLLTLFHTVSLFSQDDLSVRRDSSSEHSQERYKRVINLGIWDKISTNGDNTKYYTNNISLNLVYGQSENISGFAFSGLYNRIESKAQGVVIAPFGYIPKMDGLSIAGMQHIEYMDGVQIGGINVVGDAKGIQIGGANWAENNVDGVQIGGFNSVNKALMGVQLGFRNSSVKATGAQIGFLGNETDTLAGVQIGAVNQARTMRGMQIGIINISDGNKYPIGLVNIVKNGEMNIALTFDDMQNTVTSFRSGGQYLYGVVGFGYNFNSPHTHFVFEGGFGAHIQLNNRFRIDTEIIASTLTKIRTSIRFGEQSEEEKEREEEIRRNYDNKTLYRFVYRILPIYRFNNKFSIMAGPTLNYIQTSKMDNIALFPSHSLWKEYNSKTLKQLYIGWMAGVSYRF